MFANRTGWFVLPYLTKRSNEMSLDVIYCQQLLVGLCIENTYFLRWSMIDFFFMQESNLNWPLTSRPVSMLHVGLYRATNASIFHSSSMNGSAASPYSKLHNLGLYSHLRAFRFLHTLFAPFRFIRPFLRVLCARLLKLLIAFRDIFVLRLNFPGNKHSCTGRIRVRRRWHGGT